MSLTSFFQLLTGFWLVAGAAGDGFGGDDFANNLFSDLAPILSLFGERVTMQFMSQSMGWADNIILAMVPLGIMTAVVGAIRVGGPTWLKALIGRARESRAIVESDLMSSTSHEVCELWNGQQVVRIMGEGDIREFIILVGEDSDPTPSDGAQGILSDEDLTAMSSADTQDNEGFDAEANESHDIEDEEGYAAEDDEGYVAEDEGYDTEGDEGYGVEEQQDHYVESNEDFDVGDDGEHHFADHENYDVEANEGSDVADNEGFDDAEANEGYNTQDDEEGHDVEAEEGFDHEGKEAFHVEHVEGFEAEDNEEPEDSSINTAANLEIMELRDDEKKKHLAEYWPSTWDIISGRFSPQREALLGKYGILSMFGARRRTRETDIERSIPAGDPNDISKRPLAVLRNTGILTPNMSLNVGNTSTGRERYLVAVFGTLLQTGLLVYAGLTATYFRNNTRFQERPPDGYAFPCMAVGTLMLVPGMLICGHVVESSTSERRYRATHGKEARVVWLQRSGIVNDQSFKSFAIFPTKAQRAIVTSQRPKQERSSTSEDPLAGTTVEVTTTVATALTICGFVVQFVGLRGMNWTVPIAQLAAILLMAALRSLVRRNLAERANSEPLPPGHELDWLAITIVDPSSAPWLHPNKRVWDGEERGTQTRPTDHGGWDYRIIPVQQPSNIAPGGPTGVRKSRAHQAMLIRRDLGALAGWRGPASAEAVGLACAIEIVMETLIGSSCIDGITISWHLTSSSCGVHEPVVFHVTKLEGSWKTSSDDIEAALSLWLYSVHHRQKNKQEEAAHTPGRRLAAGTTQSQNKRAQGKESLILLGSFDTRILKRDLILWLPDNSYDNVVEISKYMEGGPNDDKIESETHRTVGFTQKASDHLPTDIDERVYWSVLEGGDKESTLAVQSPMDLKKLYIHHIFAAFMWAVSAKAAEKHRDSNVFGNEVEIQAFHRYDWHYYRGTDRLSNERLSALVQKIETTKILGSVEEIYYAILPPLSAWNLLPPVHVLLKHGLEFAHLFEQRGDWRRVSFAYVAILHKTALFPRDNRTDIASKATALVMELLRMLTETTNFRKSLLVNDDTKINQLVDSTKRVSAQVAVDNDPAIFPRLMGLYKRQGRLWKCDLVADISTYPTIKPGEFGFETLHQAACDDDVPDKQRHDWLVSRTVDNQDFLGWTPMHYAVAHGSHDVLGYVMRRGASVKIQDVRRRTPLHYAYCRDDEEFVKKLLRAGADVNASDAGGMTPLHDAAKHGAGKVAAALIEGGADIKLVDHGGRTPLAWAVWSGHGELARKHLWDPSSKIESDSDGRTPLHMAVTSEEGLGKDFGATFGFLVPTIDMDAKDKRGYTALHVAVVKGHLPAVRWLLAKGANVHAKEAGWYYSRHGPRRNKSRDLVQPGLTPLYLAKLMLRRAKKKGEIRGDNFDQEFSHENFEIRGGGWESEYSAWYEGDSDIDATGGMVRGYKRRYQLRPSPDAIKGLEDVIEFLMQFEEGREEETNSVHDTTDPDSDREKSDEERATKEGSVEEGDVEAGDGEKRDAGDSDGSVWKS